MLWPIMFVMEDVEVALHRQRRRIVVRNLGSYGMALQSQGKSSIGGNPVGEGVMLHTQRKSLVVGNPVNGILVSLIIVVTVGMKHISMIEVYFDDSGDYGGYDGDCGGGGCE